MKLVLLPGMDGTGELFRDFARYYGEGLVILPLPSGDDQSYKALAQQLTVELPNSDFVLLVESFSGGLVEHLIDVPNLCGIIFVASFVSAPNKLMLAIAKLLPLKVLTYLPGSFSIGSHLFFGRGARKEIVDRFFSIVRAAPNQILKSRLTAMSKLKHVGGYKCTKLPCFYIRPKQDRLICSSKYLEISNTFSNTICYEIEGPHFILQAEPEKTAAIVAQAVKTIVLGRS